MNSLFESETFWRFAFILLVVVVVGAGVALGVPTWCGLPVIIVLGFVYLLFFTDTAEKIVEKQKRQEEEEARKEEEQRRAEERGDPVPEAFELMTDAGPLSGARLLFVVVLACGAIGGGLWMGAGVLDMFDSSDNCSACGGVGERYMRCDGCNGKGFVDHLGRHDCYCDGGRDNWRSTCDDCGGSGKE